MKKVPEIGDTIVLKSFAFTNKHGGTGLSDWEYDEPFGIAKVKVTKIWEDDECGQRGWGVPLYSEKELIDYLKRNAKNNTIFWSEFKIIDVIQG